jgi:hypothetical protein
MPRHQQVTTCRKSGGPVSKFCSCEPCTLSVCSVCGAYEGALTTDCPGERVNFDKQQEVYETNLDYTDARGWHQGAASKRRSPQFETRANVRVRQATSGAHSPCLAPPSPGVITWIVGCSCGWITPQSASDLGARFGLAADARRQRASDDAFTLHVAAADAPSIDRTAVDHVTDLKHDLTQKAIAWVLADRICDDHSAVLTRLEDAADAHLHKGQAPHEPDRELLGKLEYEKIGFQLADQRARKCDEEFRQAAQKLVAALEEQAVSASEALPRLPKEAPEP